MKSKKTFLKITLSGLLALALGAIAIQQADVNTNSHEKNSSHFLDRSKAIDLEKKGQIMEDIMEDTFNQQMESRSNNIATAPKMYLQSQVSTERILREYSNYRDSELQNVLNKSEAKLRKNKLIEKANAGQLNEKEQLALSLELKKQSAVRILIVQRQIEKIEAEFL
jgi:hypothetical protein